MIFPDSDFEYTYSASLSLAVPDCSIDERKMSVGNTVIRCHYSEFDWTFA
jgi:hypothetical protein